MRRVTPLGLLAPRVAAAGSAPARASKSRSVPTRSVPTRGGPPRRRPASRWARHALRLGIVAGVLGVIVVGGMVLERSGVLQVLQTGAARALLQASTNFGLTVQEVLVEGRGETPSAQILTALDVSRGIPIFGFSPVEAKTRLEKLPWVRTATVERSLPDTIRVVIEERRPLALWQNHGRLGLVDSEGEPIHVAEVGRFRDLPIVVGPDAPQSAPALMRMMAAEPALARRLTAAVRVSGRRWNLRFDDKVDVRLPAEDPAGALARLAEIERTHSVLGRDIVAIDMRMPDRLVVQLAHGAVMHRGRPPEKAT